MTQEEEIRRMWEIFRVEADNPISLRALKPAAPAINKVFRATQYPDLTDRQQAFEVEALRLNAEGYNVYLPLNPICSDFIMGPVGDGDIACRRLLLIDIDRAAVAREPATDSEVAAALSLADDVAKYLVDEGWDAPARVMSGNGAHLYVPLADLSNDDGTKELLRQVLQMLAADFDTPTVKIDTAVYNAGRITKVPGTFARKGQESPDRPYRMARVLPCR